MKGDGRGSLADGPRAALRRVPGLPLAVREVRRLRLAHSPEDLLVEFRYRTTIPKAIRPLTLVTNGCLVSLARQVEAVVSEGIPGDLVECGVWKGGSAFLMADRLRRLGVTDRKVWMFDSFQGMPPAAEIDGERANAWAQDVTGPRYFDNLRVPVDAVRDTAARLGLESRVELVPGWFEDTLPETRDKIGPIAILRIDSDWYSSVRCCLENLYDLVVPGGLVVFDDYYAYDGCASAVHEFLHTRALPQRIDKDGCAFIRKA